MGTTKRPRRENGIGDVIASRRLQDADSGKEFSVRIGRPRRKRRDWECPFQIGVSPDAGVEFGHGVDAFQALTQALEGIRTRIEQRHRRFSWRGGEPGDAGFPRFVPSFYGKQFAEGINKLIDDEVIRFASEAEMKRTAGRAGGDSADAKVPKSRRRGSQLPDT